MRHILILSILLCLSLPAVAQDPQEIPAKPFELTISLMQEKDVNRLLAVLDDKGDQARRREAACALAKMEWVEEPLYKVRKAAAAAYLKLAPEGDPLVLRAEEILR